ncbi:MAG: DUF4212 domain-containing protein [Methyloligellaceae bacterium]
MSENSKRGPYWIGTRFILTSISAIYFGVLILAINFLELLNNFNLFGFPLGYLIISKGMVILAVLLCFWYVDRQDNLDHRHRMIEEI